MQNYEDDDDDGKPFERIQLRRKRRKRRRNKRIMNKRSESNLKYGHNYSYNGNKCTLL